MRHGEGGTVPSSRGDELVRAHVDRYLAAVAPIIAALSPEAVADVIGELEATRPRGGTAWTFGNGGSAAIAAHLTLDLFLNARRTGGTPVRAGCLTVDGAQLTAAVNDFGASESISTQLALTARPGNAAVALSLSGASSNALRAIAVAKEIGVTTIGVVGSADSPVGYICDHAIDLGCSEPGLSEDAAQIVGHAIYCWFMRSSEIRTAPQALPDGRTADSSASTSSDEA